MRRSILLLTAASAAVVLPMAAPSAAQQPPRPDSGFDLVVVGSMPNVPPEEFSRAVAEALPAQLVDPQSNFTRSPAYRPNHGYRLVMIFHGDDVVDAPKLCQEPDGVRAEPPADPANLRATTHVTGVFCRGPELLSQAKDRLTGSVVPGQAGFRFLVADVSKQLFPDGFAAVPGSVDAVATTGRQP